MLAMMKAKLTFLGTGTSIGVPIIGCRCPVCQSEDPHDKRFRAAAVAEYGGLRILVDAGPDFRMQMLAQGIGHLDAILLTHNHKDHTGGLDDVRALNYIDKRALDIYCEERVLQTLRREYGYAFEEHRYPGSPEWHVHVIDERPFLVRSSRNAGELVWVHDVGYFLRQPDGTLAPSDATPREAEHPDIRNGQEPERVLFSQTCTHADGRGPLAGGVKKTVPAPALSAKSSPGCSASRGVASEGASVPSACFRK